MAPSLSVPVECQTTCVTLINPFPIFHSQVFEYDLSETKFTCSTNKHFTKNQSTHIIRSIVLDPRNENIFIMQNDSFMFVLQKQEVRAINNEPTLFMKAIITRKTMCFCVYLCFRASTTALKSPKSTDANRWATSVWH